MNPCTAFVSIALALLLAGSVIVPRTVGAAVSAPPAQGSGNAGPPSPAPDAAGASMRPMGSELEDLASDALNLDLAEALAAHTVGDFARAQEIWRMAADKGSHEAQYRLGMMAENGEGGPRDERAAAAWYSLAAVGQMPDAQARLGRMYRDGRGVRHNATRAMLLLYGAAMEGHEEAMRDLKAMAPPNAAQARLFGVNIGATTRGAFRAALAKAGVTVVRQDEQLICDVYNVEKAIPGATQLAACYGPDKDWRRQPLGFVKIDYPAQGPEKAARINAMVQGRFGAPHASEGVSEGASPEVANGMAAHLWNLGDVIVATQYAPDVSQSALMYMVPRVYHATRELVGSGPE